MKHYILFVFIFALYAQSGCKEQADKTETGFVISVDIDKRDPVSVFDIFHKAEIIPLETTDESLIRNPEEDNIFTKGPAFPEHKYNYLTRIIDNRILKFSPVDDMATVYTWDFGDLNIDYKSLNYQKEGRGDMLRELFKKMYASEIINYLFRVAGENSGYLYTQIVRKNEYVNILHDKKKQQSVVFEKTIENAYFFPLYWTDDFVICHQYRPEGTPLPYMELDEIIPDAILDGENIERKKRYKEFDNPILVKYYFKK